MQKSWLAHLEKLAALNLNEAERNLLRHDLTRIIQFAADLPDCSNKGTSTSNPLHSYSPTGEKDPIPSFSLASFISSAPDFREGFLHTPSIWQHETEDENG